MRISSAERKQIENEMIFRRINEKLGTDLDAMDQIHREDGNHHLVHDDQLLIQFKCECSDENCDIRIPLQLSRYRELHLNRSDFIVKANHQVDDIESIILSSEDYHIVQKKHTTAEPGDTLNRTVIDNSLH
jgi:thermostable 8-oxoguanine DNA glycosylase